MAFSWQDPLPELRDFLRSHVPDPNADRPPGDFLFGDFPRDDLSISSYPRISIIRVTDTSRPNGQRLQLFDHIFTAQVDIWVKPDQKIANVEPTYASAKFNVPLAEKLSDKVFQSFEEFFAAEKLGKFNNFTIDRIDTPIWDEDRQVWRIIVTVSVQFGTPLTT